MVREILSPKQIANSLFPVLDACLLADDPSEAIGNHIKKHLAARMFWDRNVRDIDRYESNLKANNERKRRFRELRKQEETERGGTQGNAAERNGTPRNGGNGHYTDTDSETDTDTKTNPNTKPKPNTPYQYQTQYTLPILIPIPIHLTNTNRIGTTNLHSPHPSRQHPNNHPDYISRRGPR